MSAPAGGAIDLEHHDDHDAAHAGLATTWSSAKAPSPAPTAPINWRVETRLDDGQAHVFNTLTLTSTAAPRRLAVHQLPRRRRARSPATTCCTRSARPARPTSACSRSTTPQRIGFAQGGIYTPGTGLVNATYDGLAADEFADLRTAITGAGTTYSPTGNIDTVDLPPFVDPALGSSTAWPT